MSDARAADWLRDQLDPIEALVRNANPPVKADSMLLPLLFRALGIVHTLEALGLVDDVALARARASLSSLGLEMAEMSVPFQDSWPDLCQDAFKLIPHWSFNVLPYSVNAFEIRGIVVEVWPEVVLASARVHGQADATLALPDVRAWTEQQKFSVRMRRRTLTLSSVEVVAHEQHHWIQAAGMIVPEADSIGHDTVLSLDISSSDGALTRIWMSAPH